MFHIYEVLCILLGCVNILPGWIERGLGTASFANSSAKVRDEVVPNVLRL